MKNPDRLERHLNTPEVPDNLEERLRRNLHTQIAEEKSHFSFFRKPLVASAASVLVLLLALQLTPQTPSTVSAAVVDIYNDELKSVKLELAMNEISAQFGIQLPPDNMPVSMSKHCTIDGQQTVHLKVQGQHQGFVHLFIKDGEFDTHFWQRQQGLLGTMPWQLIQPRSNLSVLVLHSEDMNPRSVEHMLTHMFYA